MQIEQVKISEIKMYEKNAKKHPKKQVQQIIKSIKEFGFNDPIAIDENNVIIEGHGRYLAMQEMGEIEVPCIQLKHLSNKQKKAYILAHNKLTLNSGYDEDMMNDELKAIFEMNLDDGFDINMEDFGFDLTDILPDDYDEADDEVPDVDGNELGIKKGDIWLLGNHRLMCGDSTSKEDVDKLMNGKKADMLFTDPPYGINIVSDNGIDGDKPFGAKGKQGSVGAGDVVKIKVYSQIIGDDTTDTAQKSYNLLKGYVEKMMLWGGNYFIDFLPFSSSWLIWDKRLEMTSNNFADGEMVWCNFHTRVRIFKHLWNGMIQEGTREVRVHPTQKPVALLGKILKEFTEEDELIVDVFGGSGSTLMACEQLDRICYMMELDEHYCNVIIKRWEEYTGGRAEKIE